MGERKLPEWGSPEFDAIVNAAIDHADAMAREHEEYPPSGGMVEQIVWFTIRALRPSPDEETPV